MSLERAEFVKWLAEGLSLTLGDPVGLKAYVRDGARRFGRLPKEFFGLLPAGMLTVYRWEVERGE